MGRKRKRHPDAHMLGVVGDGEPALYVVVDGVRIAKRGLPDTPQAMTWISLEPGWVVRDHNYPHGIEIERRPVIVQ